MKATDNNNTADDNSESHVLETIDMELEKYIYANREKTINRHFNSLFHEMLEWEKKAPNKNYQTIS